MADENATPVTPQPEPVVTTPPTGEPPEGAPAPQHEPEKTVPLAALEDERRKRQELKEQLAYYRGLAERQPQPEPDKPAVAAAPAEPQLDDFESFEAFQVAERQYVIDKAKHDLRQEFTQEMAQSAQRRTAEETNQRFMARIQEAAKTDPDITAILSDPTLPVSEAMSVTLKESDLAPQLLRYLAANREEARRLAQLNPVLAAREMGRIEATLANAPKPAPAVVISQAPEPISTVPGSTAGGTTDLKDLPMEDFFKRRAPEIFRRR